MSQASDYLESKIMGMLFDGTGSSWVSTVHGVSLHGSTPANDGAGGGSASEIATGAGGYSAYARQFVSATSGWTIWYPAGITGSVANGAAITFPQGTGSDNITVTHFGLYDSTGDGGGAGGNLLAWGWLNNSLTITPGVTPEFAINSLQISLD